MPSENPVVPENPSGKYSKYCYNHHENIIIGVINKIVMDNHLVTEKNSKKSVTSTVFSYSLKVDNYLVLHQHNIK